MSRLSLRNLILENKKEPKGTIELPSDHKAGMKVPKGGSMCANCAALAEDGKHCQNEYFQKWQESLGIDDKTKLPHPANEFCCDWYSIGD